MLLIQAYRDSDSLVEWLRRLIGVVADVEEWRDIGDTGEPAFENSWADAGANPAFYKDPYGMVHLKGDIGTGASGTTAFTLPTGYRPSETLSLPCLQTAAAAGAWVTVNTNGTVVITRTGATVHLNGIAFRV